MKQRQVISGYTQETAYAPVAAVKLSTPERTVDFPEMLLFWHHLRYDGEKGGFIDLRDEKPSVGCGRSGYPSASSNGTESSRA